MKQINESLTSKWLTIKKIFDTQSNGSTQYGTNFEVGGEFDEMCKDFVDLLGELTQENGFDQIIEGTHLDLWKTRIWMTIENSGLLEEYQPVEEYEY